MNPNEFKPLTRSDFIGHAAEVAGVLDVKIQRARASGGPLKILLRGGPGVGKSALVHYLLDQLGVVKWAITKLNGTKVRLEDVETWTDRLCYRELGGGYKVMWIEEMDRASHTARASMLTTLDDLPDHVAVFCTSNQSISDIEPRFLSRFQVIEVQPPTADDIKTLLSRWPLPADEITRIAEFACGNVRLALNDAQNKLDEIAAGGQVQLRIAA